MFVCVRASYSMNHIQLFVCIHVCFYDNKKENNRGQFTATVNLIVVTDAFYIHESFVQFWGDTHTVSVQNKIGRAEWSRRERLIS